MLRQLKTPLGYKYPPIPFRQGIPFTGLTGQGIPIGIEFKFCKFTHTDREKNSQARTPRLFVCLFLFYEARQ